MKILGQQEAEVIEAIKTLPKRQVVRPTTFYNRHQPTAG
jgi:hypothetical protein